MAIHEDEYGTTRTGRFDGTYRRDTWTNKRTGEVSVELVFAEGVADDSPVHNSNSTYGGEYDPKCSCCWLGYAHTEQAHKRRR